MSSLFEDYNLDEFEESIVDKVDEKIDVDSDSEVSEGGKIFPISNNKQPHDNACVEKVEVRKDKNEEDYLAISFGFINDEGDLDGGYIPLSIFNPWKSNNGFVARHKEILNNQGKEAAAKYNKRVPMTAIDRVYDKAFRQQFKAHTDKQAEAKGVKNKVYNNWLRKSAMEIYFALIGFQNTLMHIAGSHIEDKEVVNSLKTITKNSLPSNKTELLKAMLKPGEMKAIYVKLIKKFASIMEGVDPVKCKLKLLQAQKSKPFASLPEFQRTILKDDGSKNVFGNPFMAAIKSAAANRIKYNEYESGMKWDSDAKKYFDNPDGWDRRSGENAEKPTNAKVADADEDDDLGLSSTTDEDFGGDDEEWDD